jgi:hypothetical protein
MQMISYLKDGWYSAKGKQKLRSQVVDGAIDAAAMLFRSDVPSLAVSSVAFRLRTMVTIADPFMSSEAEISLRGRQIIRRRLDRLTEHYPALYAFVADCLEHIVTPSDLRALYLHLFHIAQVIQLLNAAMGPKKPAGKREKVKRKKAPSARRSAR